MFKIYLLDKSAEARTALFEQFQHLLTSQLGENEVIPHVSLKPVSLSEIKFLAPPDLCLIGPEFLSRDLPEVAEIKSLLPTSVLVACLTAGNWPIGMIEQFVKLGIDDFIQGGIGATEFLRKVVLLCRKRSGQRSGSLIVVDAAKGGLGATSIAAALGERLAEHGRKVLLIDLDTDTQDLSRFIQARPFINENLQLLFERQRAVTHELVSQCCFKVWSDSELYCMTPLPDSEQLYDSRSGYSRTLLSVLEVLDSEFDQVIIDISSLRGLMAKTIYMAADRLVFLLDSDPASLYAAVQRFGAIRAHAPATKPLILENCLGRAGLSSAVLREEFNRAARTEESDWAGLPIPHCRQAQRWPGSGATLFGLGSRNLRKSLDRVLEHLELVETARDSENLGTKIWQRIKQSKIAKSSAAPALGGKEAPKLLPLASTPAGSADSTNSDQTFAQPLASNSAHDLSKLDPAELISNVRIQ